MSVPLLTSEQHFRILRDLRNLASRPASLLCDGDPYPILMQAFKDHQTSCTDVILLLWDHFKEDRFPVAPACLIARSMFETDVNAHYIAKDRASRAKQYLDYECILYKIEMEVCASLRNSAQKSWKDGMDLVWRSKWEPSKDLVNRRFNQVKDGYRKGHKRANHEEAASFDRRDYADNWAGISLYKMAELVDHIEPYRYFYSFLSSFTHADVRLVSTYIARSHSHQTPENDRHSFDVWTVSQHAVSFFMCFLKFYARETGSWTENDVEQCLETQVV